MACIIAATDGSAPARRAVDFAAGLALKLGEQLLLVSVIEAPLLRAAPEAEPFPAEPDLQARLLLEEVDRMRREGVEAASLLRVGRASSELAALAMSHEVSMVVVGSGSDLPEGWDEGLSSELPRICSKPVVVVPRDGAPELARAG